MYFCEVSNFFVLWDLIFFIRGLVFSIEGLILYVIDAAVEVGLIAYPTEAKISRLKDRQLRSTAKLVAPKKSSEEDIFAQLCAIKNRDLETFWGSFLDENFFL